MKILLVLLGGSLGAVSRYGITLLANRLYGSSFPWGTLFVNLAGCFLIGLCFALGNEKNILGPSARLFLMTGFLGALTTFSTFGMETITMSSSGLPTQGLINFLAHNIGGLMCVLAGLWIGRIL